MATTRVEAGSEGAVKTPAASMEPAPSIDHWSGGWPARAAPNWSATAAVKRALASRGRVIEPGVTSSVVGVGRTSTVRLLVTLRAPSLIVTRMLYSPEPENATTVVAASLVPLAEKTGAGTPAGTPRAAQV